MMASMTFLGVLVTVALGVTCLSPFVLLWFLYRDWKGKSLW